MKNFVVIYYAPAEALGKMATLSPEEKAKQLGPWINWKENCGDKVVNFGAPLSPGQNLDADNNWTASTKEVSGYSILQAESNEAAQGLLKDHPHLAWAPGCSISVHECMSM